MTETASIGDLQLRIREKVTVKDGHWIWNGQVNNKGYGLVHARFPAQPDKRPGKRAAHLVVYEQLVGLVPRGLELDHTCPFTACVYPGCMDEVTHAENQRRIGERQTHCRKAGHPRTPENVYRGPNGRTRCKPCARVADSQRTPRRRCSA